MQAPAVSCLEHTTTQRVSIPPVTLRCTPPVTGALKTASSFNKMQQLTQIMKPSLNSEIPQDLSQGIGHLHSWLVPQTLSGWGSILPEYPHFSFCSGTMPFSGPEPVDTTFQLLVVLPFPICTVRVPINLSQLVYNCLGGFCIGAFWESKLLPNGIAVHSTDFKPSWVSQGFTPNQACCQVLNMYHTLTTTTSSTLHLADDSTQRSWVFCPVSPSG